MATFIILLYSVCHPYFISKIHREQKSKPWTLFPTALSVFGTIFYYRTSLRIRKYSKSRLSEICINTLYETLLILTVHYCSISAWDVSIACVRVSWFHPAWPLKRHRRSESTHILLSPSTPKAEHYFRYANRTIVCMPAVQRKERHQSYLAWLETH